MLRRLRFLLAALTITMALTLTACGDDGNQSDLTTNDTNSEDSNADTAEDESATAADTGDDPDPTPTLVAPTATTAPAAEPTATPVPEPTATATPEPFDVAAVLASTAERNATGGQAELDATFLTSDDAGFFEFGMQASSISFPDSYFFDVDPAGFAPLVERRQTTLEQFGLAPLQIFAIASEAKMVVPPAGCVDLSDYARGSSAVENLLDPATYLATIEIIDQRADTELDGVSVSHYLFTAEPFAIGSSPAELVAVSGSLYVSKADNAIARIEMTGQGVLGLDQFADISSSPEAPVEFAIKLDFSDANADTTLAFPPECTFVEATPTPAESADSTLPIAPDATDIVDGESVFSYRTQQQSAELITFYEGQLAQSGWVYEESESLVVDGIASLVFGQADERLVVVIIDDDTQREVLITFE